MLGFKLKGLLSESTAVSGPSGMLSSIGTKSNVCSVEPAGKVSVPLPPSV